MVRYVAARGCAASNHTVDDWQELTPVNIRAGI